MPVSSSTEHWIKPDALTINLNHFGDPDYLQVSVLAGAVVMAFKQDVIDYNAAHNYRTWPLEAANTYLETSSSYNVYARLTRSEVNARALIVYDTVLRDIEGREITYVKVEGVEEDLQENNIEDGGIENNEEDKYEEVLGEVDPDFFYIHLGQISSSLNELGWGIFREWISDFKFGSLDTNLYRNEYSSEEWSKMFRLNKVTDMIDVLKTVSLAVFNKLSIKDKSIKDIKRSTDEDQEFLLDDEGNVLLDDKGNPVLNPLYVPISDETIPSTKYISESFNNQFLRKDKDDRSKGKISSDKGFEVGQYIKDLVGSGAKFHYDETSRRTVIEADKAFFREEMIVPKITFNCIDVVSGDKAQTFAYGTIKEVNPLGSEGEATLDLLSDQYGSIQVNDILRGVFHRLEGNNQADSASDLNGFHSYSGFSTAYFTPTAILENRAGYMRFRYQLQDGTTVHPCAGMNFYAYGNFDLSKTDRHSVTYETRQYTRRLCNMTQWTIDPDKHIKYQDGLLDGLVIGGMAMKGYGTYADNFYLTGSIIEFTPQQKEEMKGQDAYMVGLTEYVGSVRMNAKGEIENGIFRPVNVSMGGENVGSGDDNLVAQEYLLQTRIQAFKGTEELYYTEELKKGTYIASVSPVGCKAELDNGVVSITEIIDTEFCYVTIYVNCEGNASRELSYQVKVLKDGQISFKSIVFTRNNEEPAVPSATGSFDSPFPTDEVEDEEGNKTRIWSDGVPDGEAKVWMSTRIFTSDGKEPQQAEWSKPQDMTDTVDFEAIYSEQEEQPEPPLGWPTLNDEWIPPAPWMDNATPKSVWMATSVRHNGVWSDWQVVKIKGENGDASFKSFVFTRTNETPATPSGGDYTSPYPTDEAEDSDGNKKLVWSDGVPKGGEQLWVSTRIFTASGKHPQQEGWSEPSPLTDTSDFEVIYSPLKSHMEIPPGFEKIGIKIDPDWLNKAQYKGWYDEVEDFEGDAIWMATNTCKNNAWEGWQISRIKGEDGKQPLTLSVSASAVSRNSLGSYEPSNVLVHARKGKEDISVGLTIFGETETGYKAISADGYYSEYGSFWNIDLKSLSVADYKSIVLRAYEGLRSTDYSDDYDAEATVTFIGDGASGAMPRNRGEFKTGVAYCYNDEYRDFVWTADGMVYMRTSKYATGIGLEHGYVVADVSDANYWTVADRSSLMAIDTALIDNAHIAGFTFRLKNTLPDGTPVGILESQNKTLSLDAETGELYCQRATVEGSITAGEMAYSVLSASNDESWFDLTGYGMASGRGNYILPSINSGKSMQIRAICLNIFGDKSIPFNFKSDSGTTFIYVKSDWDDKFYPKTEVALDYNRLYTFTSDGNSWILSEGMSAKSDGQSALTIDTQLSDSSPNPVQNMAIAEEFKKHVKLGNADDPVQTITRPTNFTGGFSVNNKSLKYVENNGKGYWVMDGDVLVTGGVTIHASETAYKPSTIMDAVRVDSTSISKDKGKLEVVGIDPAIALAAIYVDGKTISKANGYLEVIGGAGGGGESGGGGEITPSTVMEALTVDDTTISKANGTLSVKDVPWSKISGKQTTIAGYGITDAYTKETIDSLLAAKAHKSDTLSGYGITDAKIEKGVITLGASTITPLTQELADKAYVTSIGIGESTLKWVVDGKVQEVTIPYAVKAGSLNIANKTAWGQTFFNNGMPSNVSGDMSSVGHIEMNHNAVSNNIYMSGSSSQYGSSRWKIGTTGQYLQFDIESGTDSSGNSLGTVQVLQLEATKAWVKADLQVWGDVYPYTSASYTLGTTDKRWKAVHADKIQFYNADYSITNPTNGININTYSLFSLVQSRNGVTRLHMNENGRIGVNTTDPIATLHVNGDVFVSGGFTFRSDIRKKVKLEDVELSLDDVADAPLIKHYYTDDEEKTVHVSSVAQYWNERNDWFTKEDKDGYLTMEIANAALASAISTAREFRRYKEQSEERIVTLEKRIEELERMFNELKDR